MHNQEVQFNCFVKPDLAMTPLDKVMPILNHYCFSRNVSDSVQEVCHYLPKNPSTSKVNRKSKPVVDIKNLGSRRAPNNTSYVAP